MPKLPPREIPFYQDGVYISTKLVNFLTILFYVDILKKYFLNFLPKKRRFLYQFKRTFCS